MLASTARGQQRALTVAVLAGIGWQLAAVCLPLVLGWTVARGIEDGERSAIWLGGLAIVALGAAEAGFDALRHRMESLAYAHGSAALRRELVEASLRLDEDGRDRFPAGEVVARATSDAEVVAELLDAAGYTLAQALTLPVVIAVLLAIDPGLGLVALASVVVIGPLLWRYTAVWERRSATVQEAVGHTTSRAQETIEAFKTIRGAGAEDGAAERFDTRSRDLRERATRLGRLWLVFEPPLQVLIALSVVGVLWIGGERVIDGALGIGELVAALGLVLFLADPLETLATRVVMIRGALASAARLAEVFEAPAPAKDAAGVDPGPLVLEAGRLRFAFASRPSEVALDCAELRLAPGDVALVSGRVGAGKSTLLAVLSGLRVPARGAVALGGVPLARWPSHALRREVLLVDTAPFVFAGTVADNLRLGDPDATAPQLAAAAELVDAAEFIDTLPDGYDTDLGDRGVVLSGGQRQRLGLARAALVRPAVLLLDGATSGLEPERELAVLRRLSETWQHGILVIVSSNPGAAGVASTRVEITAGVVAVS